MSDRKPTGQFQKGQSGNPGGRPKTPPEVKAMFEAKGPEAFELLSKHLKHKDPRVAQTAAGIILAYSYGKPSQSLTVDGQLGFNPIAALFEAIDGKTRGLPEGR
jgi:uncharacterized protein DUF5681